MIRMQVTVKSGILFGILFIIARMIFFYTGIIKEDITPSIFLNMFLLLTAIAIGVYKHKRKLLSQGLDSTLLTDVKKGMISGMIYSVMVSIFLFFFYSKINPEFNQHQLAEAKMGIKKMLDDPKKLKEVKKSNGEFEVMTKEQIYESLIQGPEVFYSPKSTAIISMLALLLLTTFNSLFVSLIYRNIVFKS